MGPGYAKLIDLGFALALAGVERAAVVDRARKMEADGATPDEITDALQSMRQASELAAQAKIDAARS